jgi:hypothetical protein
MYQPAENKKGAALSFHLTEREKQDISRAVFDKTNESTIQKLMLLQQTHRPVQLAQGINKE